MYQQLLAMIDVASVARERGASVQVDGPEVSIMLTALEKLKLDLDVAREAIVMLSMEDQGEEIEDLDEDTEAEIEGE